MLFDDFERTEITPRQESEPLFHFYNTSARDQMDELRWMLESWFLKFPASAKEDLRARFRSRKNVEHHGAFYELYLHELFSGLGFDLEVHPELDSGVGSRPDFRASRAEFEFYIEATVAAPNAIESAEDARAAAVIDKIHELDSPEFMLDVEILGAPQVSLSGKKLQKELARWLETLDYADVDRRYRQQGGDMLPSYNWEKAGWNLRFRAIPRRTVLEAGHCAGAIAFRSGDFKAIDATTSLFNSVSKKAKKYGDLGCPFIICVNALEVMADSFDMLNALFGREGITVWQGGGSRPSRARDGVWRGPKGKQNISTSGVLVTYRLNPNVVGSVIPELYHHPFAKHPLDMSTFPFVQHIADDDKRYLERVEGSNISGALILPKGWGA